MIVGLPAEHYPDEQRVALVPAVLPMLAKAGMEVVVERGAGERAGFPDATYEGKGARIVADRTQVFSSADLIARVRGLGADPENNGADLALMRSGQTLVGMLNPLGDPQPAQEAADRGITSFALELVPRISRAQSMDVLSSMATIAGYKAVVLAAGALHKMCPMMMTAAGTIAPARFLVIGAGVAGLQAIASSHRMGAIVFAYDIRPAVKEQVESLGAKFLEIELETSGAETAGGYAQAMGEEFYRRQRELMEQALTENDAVITTAAVPGKRAPVLVTEEMVKRMQPGSVIVDLAAEGGGNCELTRPGEVVTVHGVTILGPVNLPASIAYHASQMYARNIMAFLRNMVKDGVLELNLDDPIVRDTLLTHQRQVVSVPVRELLGLPAEVPSASERSNP